MQLLIERANFRITPRRENGWRGRKLTRAHSIPTRTVCQLRREVFDAKPKGHFNEWSSIDIHIDADSLV